MNEKKIEFITVEKASDILRKSTPAVRQLLRRGKLSQFTKNRMVMLSLDEVLSYHAKKKKLPSWENNISKIISKEFISLEEAKNRMLLQPIYLMSLIRKKLLEGYVTAAGEVMISKESINRYLRTPENDSTTAPADL